MESEGLYAVISLADDKSESIQDILWYSNGKLFYLTYKSTLKIPFKKWKIKKSSELCEIENIDSIADELFAKSSRHKHYIREYHRLDKLNLIPGKYYPRIHRPQLIWNDDMFLMNETRIHLIESELMQLRNYLPFKSETLLGGITQLSILTENLKAICRTVEPSNKNFTVFGQELRNLLILVCTEVEAQLRGIYIANLTTPEKELCMPKYFLLNEHLKLNEYEVIYNLYPMLGAFRPFEHWEGGSFTPLTWYQAYNSVKHDRENEFENANLENVLNAIAALAILLLAQYGERAPYWKDLIGQFFKFTMLPEWDVNDRYLPPFEDDNWEDHKLFD